MRSHTLSQRVSPFDYAARMPQRTPPKEAPYGGKITPYPTGPDEAPMGLKDDPMAIFDRGPQPAEKPVMGQTLAGPVEALQPGMRPMPMMDPNAAVRSILAGRLGKMGPKPGL